MAIDDHMNVNKIGGIEKGITWIGGKVPQPHFSISYKWLACLIQLHTLAYTTLSTHAALWTHMDHKINTDSTFRSAKLFRRCSRSWHITLYQPIREAVSYRELFTVDWFGVREKHCSRLEIYDRLRASEQAVWRLIVKPIFQLQVASRQSKSDSHIDGQNCTNKESTFFHSQNRPQQSAPNQCFAVSNCKSKTMSYDTLMGSSSTIQQNYTFHGVCQCLC